MRNRLSIRGDDDDWQVFGKTPPGGHEVFFRPRAVNPAVQAYALDNQMARLRCVLAPDQVREDGMPETISLKFAAVGEKATLLKGLCLSPEQERAAIAQQPSSSGGLLGKLFGH